MRERAKCRQCKRPFYWEPRKRTPDAEAPPTCGELLCRARQEWTDEQWKGQLHMIEARDAVGLPRNEIDNEALRRAGR